MNVNTFENIVNNVLKEYSADQRLPLDDDMYKLDYYLQQNGRRRRKYENKESINKIISEVLNYFLIKKVNK